MDVPVAVWGDPGGNTADLGGVVRAACDEALATPDCLGEGETVNKCLDGLVPSREGLHGGICYAVSNLDCAGANARQNLYQT